MKTPKISQNTQSKLNLENLDLTGKTLTGKELETVIGGAKFNLKSDRYGTANCVCG